MQPMGVSELLLWPASNFSFGRGLLANKIRISNSMFVLAEVCFHQRPQMFAA